MSEKICVVCLNDVAGKPRLKDSQGRYYCRSCYDALVAEGFTRPPSDEEINAFQASRNADSAIMPPHVERPSTPRASA